MLHYSTGVEYYAIILYRGWGWGDFGKFTTKTNEIWWLYSFIKLHGAKQNSTGASLVVLK